MADDLQPLILACLQSILALPDDDPDRDGDMAFRFSERLRESHGDAAAEAALLASVEGLALSLMTYGQSRQQAGALILAQAGRLPGGDGH